MATGFNTQVGNGEYRLQFETNNKEYYLLMQSTARRCVDGARMTNADVAPVQHGRWIIDNATGKIACSDCGCIYLGYYGGLAPNYCPNCGADMRGGNYE